jgi:hypothetical protein
VLNKLIDDQREELRKRDFLAYTGRNKASIPSSQLFALPQLGETASPPFKKKVVPRLPLLVHEFLPKPTPTKDEIQLNIDVATMSGKLNMRVLVTKM